MKTVVVRNIRRADAAMVKRLGALDVADNDRLHTNSSTAIGNSR